MKTQGEHIRTLRRRVDFLQARDHKNSYDQAELGALEWALVNLPPAQKPQRWAVFCQGCRKEWSVSYPHPGKDICVDCDDKPAQVGLDYEPAQPYKVIGTQPTGNICFFGTHADNSTEVLRLSKEGIWANPDVPADEAAKLVLVAMDFNIKVLVDKAVADEREQIIDLVAMYGGPVDLEAAIRARSNT